MCLQPQHVAPDLMELDERPGGMSHCFFGKQPESPAEIWLAINAVEHACYGSLRYSGRDAQVLAQLKALGLSDRCDYPA
jgi:hypothetical protein